MHDFHQIHNYHELREYIVEGIKKRLTAKRLEHTMRVEDTAIILANHYKANTHKASIAALLHDNAKNFSKDEKIALIKKYDIELSHAEEKRIDLSHGKIGSVLAKREFHIIDEDILNAVRYHTTGRPDMSQVEKIIYIADFIEPGRKPFPGLEKTRELAYSNINDALLKILMMTINHVIDKGDVLDNITERTYEYYYRIYAQQHQ